MMAALHFRESYQEGRPVKRLLQTCLVRYGVAYVKETEAAYAEQVRQRLEKQLRRRAQELGFEVKKGETPVTPQVE
jgi:hypothetical protein